MGHADNVARVLAGIGVGLAFATLVWQAVSWLLSGSRVRVSLTRMELHDDLKPPAPVLEVFATNRGRVGVSYEGFTLHVYWGRWQRRPKTGVAFTAGTVTSAEVGQTIDPGHLVKVAVYEWRLRALLHERGAPSGRVRAVMQLGTGKLAKSPWRKMVKLTAEAP